MRHVRIGVYLTEITAGAVLAYALLTPTEAHRDPVIVALGAVVVLVTPGLLLLPLPAIVRWRFGALLFYAWSIVDAAVIAIVAHRDGGTSSPLVTLMFLTLAFMAVAYPPAGVVAMGGLMTAVYLLLGGGSVDLAAGFVSVVMAVFTLTCALSSGNQWEAYDQQVLLLRTQQTLAATDHLTGCLNRRAFLERLEATTTADSSVGWKALLCLIDLDGFKAVNDDEGHAAGDRVLAQVGRILMAAVRESDSVARIGGDEFAVLAWVESEACVTGLAERLRSAIGEAGSACGVSASVGVTQVAHGEDEHEALCRADAAMYVAKGSGGDRVTALAECRSAEGGIRRA